VPRVRSPSGWPRRPIRGVGAGSVTPSRVPLSGATIRRVIKDTCPGGLADLLGHDPAGTDTLAIGGKSVRGSRLGATPAAHLLAAMTGTGMTVTQLRVAEKTNEITCFAALLDRYDLQGVTVTGDALPTRRDHARFLVEENCGPNTAPGPGPAGGVGQPSRHRGRGRPGRPRVGHPWPSFRHRVLSGS
jgi:hypothetical protein